MKNKNKWEERRARFKAALENEIAAIIRNFKRNGMVAAGWDMMLHWAGRRAILLEGYPVGVNHRWAFKEFFREAIMDNPAFAKFIMPEGGAK